MARFYIEDVSQQPSLFADVQFPDCGVMLSQCKYPGFYYTFLYDVLYAIQTQIACTLQIDGMLNDMVTMRIVEPASKLRSIELMGIYFGIRHRRQRYYESALKWLELKDMIEKQTLDFAKKNMNLISLCCFMMLPHFILKDSNQMICAKPVFQKTTNRNSRKYW